MKKFLLLLTITLLFNQCGYEKVYSGKNLNLFINEIKRENNSINNELSEALLEILSDENSENSFNLEIQSKKFTEIKSKDIKGDPSVYVLKLETKVIATNNRTKSKYENFVSKEMNYNNNDDKYELSQYKSEIEKILIRETVEEIISYLTDIR